MQITTILACIALASALVVRFWLDIFKPSLRDIPGPYWARFSDLWRLNEMRKSRYVDMLRSVHDKYGAAVRIGPNIISLSDPRAIESVYGLRANFGKSDWVKAQQVYEDGVLVHDLFSTQDKALHNKLKRPIANAYSMTTVKSSEVHIDDTIREFVQRLAEKFISKKHGRQPCAIDKWLLFFAFDSISKFAMGRSIGFLKQGGDVDGMLGDLNRLFEYRSVIAQMPILDWLFRTNLVVKFFVTPSSKFMARSRKLIKERLSRSSEVDTKHSDFMQRCLEAKERYPDIVTDTTVARYVATILLAGSDTTAVALRSVIYYVLKNPRVKERVLQELSDQESFLSYPVTFDQSQHLDYMNACLQEAFRIHWNGGHLLERVVESEGFTLPDGRCLPPKTVVGMNGWTTHFDKATYGDDVEIYRPERWLRAPLESEESFNDRLQAMKAADFSFGKGTRACIGRNVAEMELRKIVPTLFGLFDIELVHPDVEWKYEQKFFTKQSNMDVILAWKQGKSLETLRQ